MKYYAVKYALVVEGLGEMNLPEPYIYEAESIPALVADLAPTCKEANLTIVSVRPATDAEVLEYLRGDVIDDDTDPEWDEDEEYGNDNFEDDFADFIDDMTTTLNNTREGQ